MASSPVHMVGLWTLELGESSDIWMVFHALPGTGASLCPRFHSL